MCRGTTVLIANIIQGIKNRGTTEFTLLIHLGL